MKNVKFGMGGVAVAFLTFLLIPTTFAFAADYYMRADGSAANKAAATSCDDASTAMSVITHNSETFSAGDTIYICGNGGTFTTELINPSSGTSGSPISYIGTSTPTWSMTSRNWYTNGKDHLVIDGITLNNTSSGYSIQMTTTDNSTLRNITSTAPSGIYVQTCVAPVLENITSTASASDGIRIAGTNATITNPTIVSAGRYGIFLESINGATITGGSISNTTFEGIRVTNENNSVVTIDETTLEDVGLNTGATSAGIYYSGAGVTGVDLTIEDVTITGALGLGGIYLTTAPFETNRASVSNVTVTESAHGLRATSTNNIDISNSTFSDNTSDGIFFEGTSRGMVISNVTVGDNGRDGISFGDGVTNGTVKYSEIHGNGQTDTVSNGDGITSHRGSTGFTFHNNLIWGNRNAGFALISDSAADIYNNTVYFNGDSTSVNMGVRGGFYNSGTGGVFDVRNNIFFGNYPYEVQVKQNSAYLASTFDYNQYYHVGNNTVEANFADIGAGAISWATYSASNESNSNYGDPQLSNPTTSFALLSSSPVINSGVDVGLTDDYVENSIMGFADRGAYEYQWISPTSAFTSSASNLAVTFTDTSSDSDGSIASWSWDFGDSNTSTSQNPSHTYTTAGSYDVAITVTDNHGATDTSTSTVTVSEGSSSSGGSSGTRTSRQTTQEPTEREALLARIAELQALIKELKSRQVSVSCTFARNLQLHSVGSDVLCLQQYLNSNGFIVSSTGAGSVGLETSYFGNATLAALIRFQNAHIAEILTPVGLTSGTGYFGPSTRAYINAN